MQEEGAELSADTFQDDNWLAPAGSTHLDAAGLVSNRQVLVQAGCHGVLMHQAVLCSVSEALLPDLL